MNQHSKRHQMPKIIRTMSLICVVLVFLLHQVPTNTTQAQTTELDVCEDVGNGPCSVEWSPRNGFLLLRSQYRIQMVSVNIEEVIFSYTHEGAWIEKWRPDGRAFATADYRNLLVRSSIIGLEHPFLDVFEEINFGHYTQDLYENEGIDTRWEPFMVSWHPDGTKLAFMHGGFLSIWDIDADTLTPVRTLDDFYAAQNYLVAVAWSPDGTQIALTSPFEFIVLEAEMHEVLIRNRYPDGYEWSDGFEWNPNGQRVAIGLKTDRYGQYVGHAQVVVMDAATGEIDTMFATEARYITSVTWSNDGQWLAAGTSSREDSANQHGFDENALRIWNVETGELVEMLTYDISVGSVDWRPDESQLAFTVGRQIHILDFDGE